MNQPLPFNQSSRSTRKRTSPPTVVEIQIGGQLKRYQPVQYRAQRHAKQPRQPTVSLSRR